MTKDRFTAAAIVGVCVVAAVLCIVTSQIHVSNFVRVQRDTKNMKNLESSGDAFLYTSAGQTFLAADMLNALHLAPLTQWVQREIWRHQHPVNGCDAVLITDGWRSGFGAELHVVGSHLAYAIENGLTLVWGERACDFLADHPCGVSKCECFFRPLSNCSSDHHHARINGTRYRTLIPTRFKEALQEQVKGLTPEQMLYWWRAQSVGYLGRLNSEALLEVRRIRLEPGLHRWWARGGDNKSFSEENADFPLPSGTVNVHIRGGDKSQEMSLVDPGGYIDKVAAMVETNPLSWQSIGVYLTGDDESSLLEAGSIIQGRLGWPWGYSRIERLGNKGFWMSDLRNSSDKRAFTLNVIQQLLIALEASGWVGVRGSNWCRLIDELRCVWVAKCDRPYAEAGHKTRRGRGTYDW